MSPELTDQVKKVMDELGHRRIGIILGLQCVTTSQERPEGYRNALKEEGIPFHSSLVKQAYSQVAGGSEAAMEKLPPMNYQK